MKRKIVRAIILGLTVCSLAILFTACGKKKEHQHNFGEWTVTEEATCTENGTKIRTCECGITEDGIVYATGHHGGVATCQAKAVCEVCGIEYGSFGRHNYADEYTVDIKPTCTFEGEKSKHCLTEGCCVKIDKETVEPTGHHGGEATCVQKAVCEECGIEYGEFDANNHNYTQWVETTAANCSQKQIETEKCAWCEQLGTQTREGELAPDKHNYSEWEITTVATCTQKQVETEKCAWCHNLGTQTKEGNTNPNNHDYEDTVISPTCKEKGYTKHSCKTCNFICFDNYVDTVDHTYGKLIAKVEPTCSETGFEAHYKCSVCEKYFDDTKVETLAETLTIDINPLNHTYVDDHTWQHTCSGCGEKIDVLVFFKDETKETDLTEDKKIVTGLTEYGKTVSYIAIPEGVTTIADKAFYECTAESVEISTTVTTFGSLAFGRSSIKKVYIKNLENYCKTNASGNYSPFSLHADLYLNGVLAEDLVLPDGVTSLAALVGCPTIKSLTLGSGFTSVGTRVFDGFTNLTTVTFSSATTSLSSYVFCQNTKIEKIVIKNPTISMSMYSIDTCPNLKTIEFNGTMAEWKACLSKASTPIIAISPACVIHCTDGKLDINGKVV